MPDEPGTGERSGEPRTRFTWLWGSIALPALLLIAVAWLAAQQLHAARIAAEALAHSRSGIDQVSSLRIALLDAVQSFRSTQGEAPAGRRDPDQAVEDVRRMMGALRPEEDDSPLVDADIARLRETIRACLALLDYRRIAFLVHDDAALSEMLERESETLQPALSALEELEINQRWIGERREQVMVRENDALRRALALAAFAALGLQVWIWLVIRQDRRRRARVERRLRETNEVLESHVAERTATLALANRDLAALSSRLLQVQEQERRALALELHNQIGNQLAALLLNLRVMEGQAAQTGDAESAARVHDCTDIVETTYAQVRDLALDLRPSLLDRVGLVPTIEWYARCQEARAGCRIAVASDPLPHPLNGEIATAAFRIVQEAVSNAIKHGAPKRIDIAVRHCGEACELSIRDDGKGFDVRSAPAHGACGLGLMGMRERATLAGGSLSISSRVGGGTEVCAKLPSIREQ